MTIRLLRTLVAVADAKTFSAAADIVHVTHAAVSQQMQTLEAELGITLFNRTTRTPELTPLGLQVVARARKLVTDYDNLVPSVLADGGLSGVINFGAVPTTLTGLTPRAMATLKANVPQIGLHIRPGLTRTLLTDVERGTLDAALVTKPHLLPRGLIFRDLTVEPLRLITAQTEPETDPHALLKTRPFIRFNRDAVVGALIDTWLLDQALPIMETMELDSLEAIISMVHENLGVSIVPALTVPPISLPPLQQITLGPTAPARTLGLVHKPNHIKGQALDALYEALATVIETTKA